jgi:Putative MetA-pathway of phenol degradation
MLPRIFIVLVLLVAGMTPLSGQSQPANAQPANAQPANAQPATSDVPGPISTDRPAVTNSSVVVPAGSLVVENGFLETGSQGQSTVDGPETLLRVGVARKTELRFSVPDYFGNLGAGPSGFGDFVLGVKQQLGPVHKFDLSAILFVSFPTGASGISSGGYDPGLQVPWSRALSANWTAAGMFALYAPTQGRMRNVTGESTFLFDRQLTKPWDAFIEYAGDFPESGGPRHLLHFGTSLKITQQQQIDFHVGFGLSAAAVDHLIGVGYSFQWQAIHSPAKQR